MRTPRSLGTFDVVVVGAGPAGASTAMHLAARAPHLRIAIVERQRIPREKPCGGAVSRWGLDVLARLDASPDRLGVPTIPIRAIRVRHGVHVGDHVASGAALGVLVRRDRFDAALAREAVARGATLFEGRRVIGLARNGDRWTLSLEGERVNPDGDGPATIEARMVVGADGTGSAVRRLAGLAEEGPRARLIVLETEAVAGDDVHRGDGGVIEFDLSCVDDGIDGYVWHFATPLEGATGTSVSRGIYDWRGRRAGDAIELRSALDGRLTKRGVDVAGVRHKPYTERVFAGARGPLATSDGVLLAGEAAGLVDPVTGEGIAQALASGECAADAVYRAVGVGRLEVRAYGRAIAGLRFHGHLRDARALAPIVYGARASLWCAALARCPTAIAAGVDWYVGAPLGWGRKAAVGAALATRALVAATSPALRARSGVA